MYFMEPTSSSTLKRQQPNRASNSPCPFTLKPRLSMMGNERHKAGQHRVYDIFRGYVVLLGLAASMWVAASGHADIVFTNLTQTSPHSGLRVDSSGWMRAQPISTDNRRHELEGITLFFPFASVPLGFDGGGFQASIWSDEEGLPGVMLAILVGESDPRAFGLFQAGNYAYVPEIPIVLEANTRYHVVAENVENGYHTLLATESTNHSGTWEQPAAHLLTQPLGTWEPHWLRFVMGIAAKELPGDITDRLVIVRQGATLLLSWQHDGHVLEQCPDLQNPDWRDIAETEMLTTFVLDGQSESVFFRLRKVQ
jgi:hypothetical protein